MKLTKFVALLIATTTFALTSSAEEGVPKDYPLKTCPVSGEEFGGDMTPYKVTYEGTDVWLCCKSCKKKFDANPAKFTQVVKDAKK